MVIGGSRREIVNWYSSLATSPKMKFVWFPITSLLLIHAADAFVDLFKPRPSDKPGILDFLSKPKIPGVNIQLGSHLGSGTFGFGFGFGTGGYAPPHKETVNVKPDFPVYPWDVKKEKVGPRPNWGDEKDEYPKPGSHDDGKEDYPKPPGSYEEDADYPKPGRYDEEYPNTGSFKDKTDETKPEEKKDGLPDWEDIGEKDPKSESLMDGDLVGEGLIQPRLNTRRRTKRFVESKVYHVPLLFQSNAKPYKVKISSNPNSLTKRNAKF